MFRGLLTGLVLWASLGSAAGAEPRLQRVRAWLPRLTTGRPAVRTGFQQVRSIRPLLFEAGVPTESFTAIAKPDAWGRQRQDMWCWAATSQMVLNYAGVPVSQEEVVHRAFGGLRNTTSDPASIAVTLDGWKVVTAEGAPAVVRAEVYPVPGVGQMIADLSRGRPLIVGLRGGVPNAPGHAYVATSITYDKNFLGWPIPVSVKLRDPWPTNPSLTEIGWPELVDRWIEGVRLDLSY
jgi:hypothetical protein